jgi:hypothetical protein
MASSCTQGQAKNSVLRGMLQRAAVLHAIKKSSLSGSRNAIGTQLKHGVSTVTAENCPSKRFWRESCVWICLSGPSGPNGTGAIGTTFTLGVGTTTPKCEPGLAVIPNLRNGRSHLGVLYGWFETLTETCLRVLAGVNFQE